MTTFLVTRHPGAVQWAAAQGIAADVCCPHLDPADVATGDTVIGTLPVHLVAEVCARGAHFLGLSLGLPHSARGRELSARELVRYRAHLQRFDVRKLDPVGENRP